MSQLTNGDYEAPQVVIPQEPEYYNIHGRHLVETRAPAQNQRGREGSYVAGNDHVSIAKTRSRDHRLCGLRRSTFWLLAVLATITVLAAVGGSVGGSLAVANAKKAEQVLLPSNSVAQLD